MLSFPNGRPVVSVQRPVAAGFTIDQEGKALVATQVGGVFGVRKSAGSGAEVFLGVSIDMLKQVTELAYGEVLVQGAGNTITIAYAPVGSTIRIVNNNTGTVQAAGSAANANEYSISGQVISLNAAQTGNAYTVTYKFNPTVVQVIALFGNVHPGGAAGDYLGLCGVIEKGDVFTSEYDTAVDWGVASPLVRLGANGIFTTAGSGTLVPNVTVIQAPSLGVGFLGLNIR